MTTDARSIGFFDALLARDDRREQVPAPERPAYIDGYEAGLEVWGTFEWAPRPDHHPAPVPRWTDGRELRAEGTP